MMRRLISAAALAVMAAALAQCGGPRPPPDIGRIAPPCPPDPHPFELRAADPATDTREAHEGHLEALREALGTPNRTILLGPDVVLDFSTRPDLLPLPLGRCVTLTSVAAFRPDAGPARTPRARGPLLRFGSHPAKKAFLEIRCHEDMLEWANDHVRISGFRLQGPSLGQQDVDQYGISVHRCLDVEISNMEIFGWGGAGVSIADEGDWAGPGQEPPSNRPGDRIGRPGHVRILNSHIHHNQHAAEGGIRPHAAGYGVVVGEGAWAQIHANLFDFNRHAIAATGKMGGYDARRNLTLKGGGYHGGELNAYTHQFDMHGTGYNGMGGWAGTKAWFFGNAFQYTRGAAIKIRGRPRKEVHIGDNVFPHRGLEKDRGHDAIHLTDRDHLDVIKLRPGNVVDADTYGRYGVCDLDGDGVDDLFLATGKTWWFSSAGEFPWSFLAARNERLEQVRLGYFDGDLRCDVLAQGRDGWVISSGGAGPWTRFGAFGAQLADVAFGQLDPARRDRRPGATRRTTHAFRRLPDGQWQVTPLSRAAWVNVQSSAAPMRKLRFGDFTGDGVTDVLAVQGGRWAISESARGAWRPLNPDLGDDVSTLFIADLDQDNIDDLLKLETTESRHPRTGTSVTYTWYVSEDGRTPWRKLKEYTWSQPPSPFAYPDGDLRWSGRAFAGRFGAPPRGAVLLTGPDRIGHFFSPGSAPPRPQPDWRSPFAY